MALSPDITIQILDNAITILSLLILAVVIRLLMHLAEARHNHLKSQHFLYHIGFRPAQQIHHPPPVIRRRNYDPAYLDLYLKKYRCAYCYCRKQILWIKISFLQRPDFRYTCAACDRVNYHTGQRQS
jgi:hypothetical protein